MARKPTPRGQYSADLQFAQHAYQNSLPIPPVIDTLHRGHVALQIRETSQFLGLYDADGDPLHTTVWGYGAGATTTYPGPTILAYEGHPVTIAWQNKLPIAGHILPVDAAIDVADPPSHRLSAGFVPTVTHLHGGHSASAFDGLPDQWFTQTGGRGANGPRDVGPSFVSATAVYPNDQQAATLWYHDHALGLTRLNVYAGLAGFYILENQERLGLVDSGALPDASHDIGMAIQDRAFTATGRLYYPAYADDALAGQVKDDGSPMRVRDVAGDFFDPVRYPGHSELPSAVPEFFGDTILVNGMAWPDQTVAAGTYEFRLLNGSDSRFYVLKLDDPDVKVTLVGTDGGLLSRAVTIMDGDGVQEQSEALVLAPGDRVELVFDFANVHRGPGETTHAVHLQNVGPAFSPFQGFAPSGELAGDGRAATAADPVGNVMQFTVDMRLPAQHATVTDGTPLAAQRQDLTADADHDGVADQAAHVRRLGLFEQQDEYGRTMPLLGTAEEGPLRTSRTALHDGETFGPLEYQAPTTETPTLFTTEDWQVFNFTADSHPIHLHLVQFQVVAKRQMDFQDSDDNGVPDDANHDGVITYGAVAPGEAHNYAKADIWIGDPVALRPEETGWQDTVEVDPHQMMSIVATFDRPGGYVWHCHILSHEDHDMMRPFTVTEPVLL
ncbi:multicopper oxidase family protein [Alsobacter sp. SYSU BS001988]